MARNFKPYVPFNVAMKLLIPTYSNVKGTEVKTFPDPKDAPLFYGSFRSFVGAEVSNNDLNVVSRIAYVDTWYRPDIKSNCRIYICNTGDTYEIVGDPENIALRNQWFKIRVQKIGGGA